MDGIREKFERAIQAFTTADDRLTVAVSGGADSMCLLWLCLTSPALRKESLSVVSVDHKIRGKESAEDLRFVEEFCNREGVQCIPFTVDVPALSAQSGRGIETEARAARYGIFTEILTSGKSDKVLTAHHRLDNVETVLMHLFRGAGLNGVRGMQAYRDGILRPLLEVSKAEIDAYVSENRIPFVTDKTNADSETPRNFIRNELLPLVCQKYPAAEQAIVRFAGESASALGYIEHALDPSALEIEPCAVRIALTAMENPFLAPYYVTGALKKGFGMIEDIEQKHVASVVRLLCVENGVGVDLPQGLRAVKEYGFITIYRTSVAATFVQAAFQTGITDCGGVRVAVSKMPQGDVTQGDKGIVRTRQQGKSFMTQCPRPTASLYFDLNKIPAGAVFRFRREGDVFCPYGGGTKKLKEYLIDKKIPLRLRDGLACIADGNEILAIAGVEISDKIKVESGADVYRLDIIG